jgi:hypothetical protein
LQKYKIPAQAVPSAGSTFLKVFSNISQLPVSGMFRLPAYFHPGGQLTAIVCSVLMVIHLDLLGSGSTRILLLLFFLTRCGSSSDRLGNRKINFKGELRWRIARCLECIYYITRMLNRGSS